MQTEAAKERIKFNTEMLRIVSAIIVIISGGIIGLLLQYREGLATLLLIVLGIMIDIVAVIFIVKILIRIHKP